VGKIRQKGALGRQIQEEVRRSVSIMKKRIKLRFRIDVCLYAFMIFLLLPANVPASTPKTIELRNKMSEILSLREKLTAKQAQAFQLCEKLKGTMRTLEEEIKAEKRSLKIESYHEAIRSPRIHSNIKLIQKLLAYISALDGKIQYLRIGTEELKFLYRQAEDDLRILETLNDMEIQKLMDQITQISEKYHSEVNKLLIDGNGIVLTPSEVIWRNISNKRN
jgi:hypothetical protein